MKKLKKIYNNIDKGLVLTGTLLLVMSAIVYRKFIIFNNFYLFNDAGGDTLISYWPHYKYIFSKIQSGDFSWWNFSNGIGNSVVTRIQDLVDPFNIPYYFISPDKIIYLLGYMAILKIILSGMFFYMFLGNFSYKRYTKTLVSLMYGFSGYMILWGQHYAFATIIVYIPLLLHFYELWYKKGKFIGFVIVSCLISSFSFYFTYITSIFLFLYALVRYIEDKSFYIKEFSVYLLKTLCLYLLGIMMSAAILFPYLSAMLSSPRVGGKQGISILAFDSLRSYIVMLERMLNNDIVIYGQLHFDGWWNYYESPILYCGLFTLIMIPQIFKLKDKKFKIIYSILIGVLAIFLIFPFFSYMMNGFSAAYYRWTYIIIVFELYILAKIIDEVLLEGNFSIRGIVEVSVLFLTLSVTALLYGYYKNIGWDVKNVYKAISVIKVVCLLVLVYCTLLYLLKNSSRKKSISNLIVLVTIAELVYFANIDVNNRKLVGKEYIKNQGYYDNSLNAVDYIKSIDSNFYRIDKNFISQSYADSYVQDYRGVKAYDSLNKFEYLDFIRTLKVEENYGIMPNFISGFYDRQKLEDLFGVKYLIVHSGDNPPYGYTFLKKFSTVDVYKNNNYLPLAFSYDKVLDVNKFKNLNTNAMDDAILRSAIVDEKLFKKNLYDSLDISNLSDGIEEVNIDRNDILTKNLNVIDGNVKEYAYTPINSDPNIIINLSNENVTYKKVAVNFTVNLSKSEDIQVFWQTKSKDFIEEKSKTMTLKSGDNKFNLEISDNNVNKIRIDLGSKGEKYLVKNIKVLLQGTEKFNNIQKDINSLKKDEFLISSFKDDLIKGSISTTGNKILCFSIPFDKGWKVFIDGKQVETHKINVGLLGVELSSGFHDVKLQFRPCMLNTGIIVSIGSFVMLFLLSIYVRRVSVRGVK